MNIMNFISSKHNSKDVKNDEGHYYNEPEVQEQYNIPSLKLGVKYPSHHVKFVHTYFEQWPG